MSEQEGENVPTRVMIAGKVRYFCEALAGQLDKREELAVTPVSEELPVAYRRIMAAGPDVLVVDLYQNIWEMLDLTLWVTAETDQKVVVVGVRELEHSVAAVAAGARGFSLIRDSVADLVRMIGKVRGGEFVTPSQTQYEQLVRGLWERSRLLGRSLTPNVGAVLGKGGDARKIAKRLDASRGLVDRRVQALFRDLEHCASAAALPVTGRRRRSGQQPTGTTTRKEIPWKKSSG